MPISPVSHLQIVLSALLRTSSAAIAAAFAWWHWLGVRGDAFSWLHALLAAVLTALWLVLLLMRWQKQLDKTRDAARNKARKDAA